MDAPSHADLMELAYEEATTLPTRFDPAIVRVDGSDINVVLNVAASMAEEVAFFAQASLGELRMSSAKGPALDRLVYDLYQLPRFGADSAVVELSLTRSPGAALSIPAGTSFATSTGVTFLTVADAVFGSNAVGPLLVTAQAEKTGVSGNVAGGQVWVRPSTVTDRTVATQNALAASGGTPAETDDELRTRAREYFATARRGTLAAIEFGARTVGRVGAAKATELTSPDTGLPGYRVQITIADSTGQASPALATRISDGLQEYRAAGVPVSVIASVPQYVTIRLQGISFRAGSNTGAVVTQIRAAILSAVNLTQPGEVLLRSTIMTTLGQIPDITVFNESVVEPAGDVYPDPGSTVRTSASLIEVNA